MSAPLRGLALKLHTKPETTTSRPVPYLKLLAQPLVCFADVLLDSLVQNTVLVLM